MYKVIHMNVLELFFCSDLCYDSGHAPTQNMLIINNNSSRMTQNLLAVFSDLLYSTPFGLPSAIIVVFKSVEQTCSNKMPFLNWKSILFYPTEMITQRLWCHTFPNTD